MTLSNLSPGITVRQERISTFPNITTSTLPVVLIGLNRELIFQRDAQLNSWSASTPSNGNSFPGYESGRVEAGVANPALKPRFYVENSFGTAEITDNVTIENLGDGSTGEPLFNISAGFSAVFDLVSGTEGCYNVNPGTEVFGKFVDSSADFVFQQVRRGDTITVADIDEYEVTTVVSDTELAVRRIGKGPERVGPTEASKLRLSVEDENDFRILSTSSDAFIADGGFLKSNVKVGDLVRVDNWQTRESSDGVIFTRRGELAGTQLEAPASYTVGAEDRVMTFANGLAITPNMAPFNNETGAGTVLLTVNSTGRFVPTSYAVSAADGVRVAFRDYATTPLVAASDSDSGAAFQAANLTAVSASTTGAFTAEDGLGQRTFTDVNATFSIGSEKHYILIPDTDGVYRPMFEVVAETSGTVLLVEQFSPEQVPGNFGANNVDYKLVSFDASSGAGEFQSGGFGTVTATADAAGSVSITSAHFGGYVLEPKDRVLTVTGMDFSDDDIIAGEYVFSDTGLLLFQIKAVPNAGSASVDSLVVTNARNIAISLADEVTLDNFGFNVRRTAFRSNFVVTRVIDEGNLEVRQAAEPGEEIAGTQAVQGFIWFSDPENFDSKLAASVTTADVVKNIPYTIKKTVSGSNLSGTVRVSYAIIKDNLVGLQQITADNFSEVLGDDVIDNPLGLAARIYFGNTAVSPFVIQVKEDTLEGWQAAAEAARSSDVYNIVPLTQDESVLAIWRAHVIEESLPENKRERILWQSHKFETDVIKATNAPNEPLAEVSRSVVGDQTVVVFKDLLALGVTVGDNFEGTFFDGSTQSSFEGRIIGVTLDGSATRLEILPDGEIEPGVEDMIVVDYTIMSRPLSLAEQKNEIVAYPKALINRRIRNIFPDTYEVRFSDNTGDGETNGFYGGGVQTVTAGGHFAATVEAAKKVLYGPALPLTKRGGSGIVRVLDTFAEAPGFRGEIVDAGNYYMESRSGPGSNVQTIRALSTDARDLTTAEESVTTQIDSFVRRLRTALTPFLGPEILNQRFFDLVSTTAQSVVTRTLNEQQLREIRLVSIRESAEAPDTFIMEYTVVPFFSGARADVTIYF